VPHDKVSISIHRKSDVMIANMTVMRIAKKMGLSQIESTLCATAVSELATNIIRYADSGDIVLYCDQDHLHILAKDNGPGIADIALAMQEGHSGGSGLGMGLSGVARIMDSMNIKSQVGLGTTITASKQLRQKVAVRQRGLGVSHAPFIDDALLIRPFPGESSSGDGGLSLRLGREHFMALWDVSGHGKEAYQLSRLVTSFMRSNTHLLPTQLLQALHKNFQGTRGLVAVLARLHVESGRVDYAGIGNITLLQQHAQGLRRLPLQEGVLGYQIRSPRTEQLQLHRGDGLIMYSDGIRTIQSGVVDLKKNRAATLANQLVTHFRAQQADDASCLILRYGMKGVINNEN